MKALRLFLLLLIASGHGQAVAADRASPTESPHAQAIRLVMEIRADEIRKLDKDPDWWHDTKERAWSAKRPFGPGVVDSTHYFMVSYAIDGHVVGSWSVNTRTGQVAGPGESLRIE
ncbi:hypothetical protein [Lysobacter sp. P5_B9]